MKVFTVFQILNSIIAILFFVFLTNAQDNFKGIIPFITTKEEVEKKLGKPDKFGRYELKEGRISINYRENKCSNIADSCLCLAPIGTVLNINIELNYDLYEKDLKLNPKRFKKSELKDHVQGITVYVNNDDGIVYEIREGKVYEIRYSESKKTCSMLTKKRKK